MRLAHLQLSPLNIQSGISLIELMLACALGAFLMLGLVQVYLSVEKTFSLQHEINAIQENARFATHFLSENIREAGYANCENSTDFVRHDLAIQGYQNNLPNFLQEKVLRGTDSIVIGRCVSKNGIETFTLLAFFINATTRKNKLGQTIYALYEMPVDGSKRELVSGVENMQIRYGVGNVAGDDIVQYVSAEEVSDWRLVRAVDIALLLNSQAPVVSKAKQYEFAGRQFPADRFLHREWRIYVALREQ